MEEQKTEFVGNTNPLGITDELREALQQARQEQLNYQIPVDLE